MTNPTVQTGGGMRAFVRIWLGLVVSQMGTGLTRFVLGVWVYQQTRSTTMFALILVLSVAPGVLMGPFSGAIVDRVRRRAVIRSCDATQALLSLTLAALVMGPGLELWHVYVAVTVSGVVDSLQRPAYMAAMTLMIPREQLGRASGMMQFGPAAAQIVSPLLAALLLAKAGMQWAMVVDATTFLFAFAMVSLVAVPELKAPARVASFVSDMSGGWKAAAAQPGLLGLLVFYAAITFNVGMAQVLMTPMLLSFAGAQDLARVGSIAGIGLLVGSVVMMAWGGPRRRMYGVLGATLLFGACLIVAGLRPSVPLVALGLFGLFMGVPIAAGSDQVIWQTRIRPEVQGRVFAFRTMVATAATPLAFLLAGPLADRVLQPLLSPGGALSSTVGSVVGTDAGRGAALLMIAMGGLTLLLGVYGFMDRRIRLLEDLAPAVELARAGHAGGTPSQLRPEAVPAEERIAVQPVGAA